MIQHPNYTFKSSIGQGGMASVWLADHKTLRNNVAIKILNKEFTYNDNIRKRFLAEARNMFTLNHPNVVRVTDLIEQEDIIAFVMEYIEGETLKDYLEQKGKLTDDEIKNLLGQMLDALGYIHEQGFVHRDIKPSNFIITSKGLIKLLDFGIAKNTDKNSAEYTQTGTTQNMGTPMYMSPEQVKSTKDVTAQSDIYSLGVVLWQMVRGEKPYNTETISTWELQTKIVNEPLPSTSTNWDRIIQSATSKELSRRFKSAESFQTEISKLAAHRPEAAKPKVKEQSLAEETIIDARSKPNSEETVLIDQAVSEDHTIIEERSPKVKKNYEKLTPDSNIFKEYFKNSDAVSYYFNDNLPAKKWRRFVSHLNYSNIPEYRVFLYSESSPNLDWEEMLQEKVSSMLSSKLIPKKFRLEAYARGFAIVLDKSGNWHLLLNESGGFVTNLYLSIRKKDKHLQELLDEPGVLNFNICHRSGAIENMRITTLGRMQTIQLRNFLISFILEKTDSLQHGWDVYSIRE